MKEQLIEIAKEKGFDSNIQIIHDNYKSPDGGKLKKLLYYLWMCEFQKWLIEKHNCVVEIHMHSDSEHEKFNNKNDFFYYVEVNYYGKNFDYPQNEREDFSQSHFNTYEEALEKGLYQALQLIKN